MRKLKFDINTNYGTAIVDVEDDSLTEEEAIEFAEEQLANTDWKDDPSYGVKIIENEGYSEPDVVYKGIVKNG